MPASREDRMALLGVGDKAPAFRAPDQDGKSVSLKPDGHAAEILAAVGTA